MAALIESLEAELVAVANPKIASEQKAYMRNQFDFYGIKTPDRRMLLKPVLSQTQLPDKAKVRKIIEQLWSKPQREYQYFGQELLFKYRKQFTTEDLQLLEFMIINKSWWDTVDYIAAKLLGHYFMVFPKQRQSSVERWLDSQNIWLQRSCLLFQLKYKNDLDTGLQEYVISRLVGTNEFFIDKAIGWVLREYSKTNPDYVRQYAEKTNLSSLSYKEATRLLK